jgi:predicted nucleotidyltransferase
MEKTLEQLTGKLKAAFDTRLVSVIVYGSAASGEPRDAYSDINVLCVLEEVTPRELGDSEAVFRWWRGAGHPSPLLMSRDEVVRSADCFPIEFHDMRERRRVLLGEDVIEGLVIEDRFHRAEVEHELRSKLLRLRQKATALLSDREVLLRLMADSTSTFCVLARHALRLAGQEAPMDRRGVLEQAGREFSFEPLAFYTLMDLREGKRKPREVEAVPLLEQYLREIEAVIAGVDRLEP